MLKFTFTHKTLGAWTTKIRLKRLAKRYQGLQGWAAGEWAARRYKRVFPGYYPGHPDVIVTISGV